jgi:GT2 family glycosyltransferase
VGPVSDYAAGAQNIGRNLPDGAPSRMGLLEVSDLLGQANIGKAIETKLLIGFCMLVPRRVLDEVGLLDEELFLGNDDLDLSWRLRLKGYKLLVATDAFIHHDGQVSFKSESETRTSRLVQESTDRLYAKLEAHYGADNVPSPMELWGVDWFKPTLLTPHSSLLTPHPSRLTSIVILTHNGLEHTKQCLASIEVHTPEPHELIIVDNGSTDGTLDYLRDYAKSREHIRVIANRDNRGFAAGNNQGLALANGNYLLLLNNDTVVTAGWLGRMLAVLDRHPEVGIVGPFSNYVSGQQLIKKISYASLSEMQAFASRWAADHAGQSRPIKRVVGFCLLMRRAVVDRIGGLDERFGSGNFEDDDLCLRAAQVGFAARVAEDVFIHHTGSQTFKSMGIDYRKSMERNWELFKAKWGIPMKSRVEQGYRLPLRLVNGSDLAVSLPDLGARYDAEMNGRWRMERQDSGAHAAASHGVAENGRAWHYTIQGDEDRCSALALTGEGM